MTNIRSESIWPSLNELRTYKTNHQMPTVESLTDLFVLRTNTYGGFACIEKDKGLLQPTMSLSTTQGQEAIRVLVQRGIEEMVEAYDSHDRDHYLEELIDAVNYFWVMAIIDPKAPLDKIIQGMSTALFNHVHRQRTERIGSTHLGHMLVWLSPIFEKLRNRSWMVNPQSPYFDGWPEIMVFLAGHLCLVWDQFDSWQEFVQFFIAKDRVLQFRLRTKY